MKSGVMYHFPRSKLAPIRPWKLTDRPQWCAARPGTARTPIAILAPSPRSRRSKPVFWDEATRTLGQRDRVLRTLIRAHPDIHLVRRNDPFTTLARAIVGQQISVKAADVDLAARSSRPSAPPRKSTRSAAPRRTQRSPLPTALLLRECGLSGRKVEYLRDLASHFASGALDPKPWRTLDDEALIEALVEVKGIGRWTAEMFLMFHELRADVLPVDDIGLQRAIALHYNDGERPTPAAMRELAHAWQPYRSVATWYLWRSLDPIPVEY